MSTSSSFGVALPRAYIFEPLNRCWVADYLGKAMDRLSDGSCFDAQNFEGPTAAVALEKMKDSAVWLFAGHGNSANVLFDLYGQVWTYLVTDKSNPRCQPPIGADKFCSAIDNLPENALDDVFLVVFLSCLTGWDDKMASSLIKKGVDIVVAFRKKLDFDGYPVWVRGFFEGLNSGMGIRQAIGNANNAILDPQKFKNLDWQERNIMYKKFEAFSIYGCMGSGPDEKLLPARYGRKGHNDTYWVHHNKSDDS